MILKIFFKIIDFFKNMPYNNIAGSDTLYTRETEFMFKRYVISSDMGEPPFGVAF